MVIFAALLAAAPAAPVDDQQRSPVTARDLVEVAEISGVSLSPDGRRVAYRISRPSVAANETRLDWYVADPDGETAVHAGNGGIARFDGAGLVIEASPVWDKDSRGLRYLAFDGGFVAIWHWREGDAARREIVDDADITGFEISADGTMLRYTTGATRAEVSGAEKRAYDEGVLVDARVDLSEAIAGGAVEGGKRVMQRLAGPWFDRRRILWDAPQKQTLVTLGTSAVGAAPEFVPAAAAQAMTVAAADGSRGEALGDTESRRVMVTRPGGARIACRVAICRSPDLVALAWIPGRDALLLFEKDGSNRETVWLWPVGDRTVRLVAKTDGAMRVASRPPRCAVGRSALICAEMLPTYPPRLLRIDYQTGAGKILADPNQPLAARIRAQATPLALAGGISGMLLMPIGAKTPAPVVVQNYHCGGFLKGGTGEEIPMLPLVEHGIAILCIDPIRGPRGGGVEGTYDRAMALILDEVDRLASSGRIDPDRVGIAGFSYGSGVALWSLRHSQRFAAATIATGQISPHYYWSNAVPDRGFAATLRGYWDIGDPDTDPARWKIASAVGHVAAIDTPLLMQLPDSEASWTIELHTKLKQAGKPAEMVVFPDEPHNKTQPVHKLAAYQRNLDWFRFWLKGEEDPAAVKADQYRRWRSFRAGQSLQAPAR